MRKKHRANFVISHEMLLDVLDLPEGSVIVGIDVGGNDIMNGQLSILIEHKDLPLVKELEVPHNIYTIRGKGDKVVFCGWDT